MGRCGVISSSTIKGLHLCGLVSFLSTRNEFWYMASPGAIPFAPGRPIINKERNETMNDCIVRRLRYPRRLPRILPVMGIGGDICGAPVCFCAEKRSPVLGAPTRSWAMVVL
jgi:hypothetical protein